MNCATHIIVGGGMAYTFLKAKGYNIGNSLFEADRLENAKNIIALCEKRGIQLLLPIDSIIADKFDNEASKSETPDENIPEGWMGLDIGKSSIDLFRKTIMNAKVILWNGPMGVFEMENFANGTSEIAKIVAQATQNGSYSLVGGGDSVAAVKKFNLESKVSYVSTGGGALLECFEGKVLPGIQAVLND
jgi:phosphoglycerate kinase